MPSSAARPWSIEPYGHEVLAQHVANAVQRSSRRGWRFDKPSDGVEIDGLIALTMAWDRSQHREAPAEFLRFRRVPERRVKIGARRRVGFHISAEFA